MLSDITGLGPDYHVGDEAMAEVAIDRLKALVGAENLILGCASPEKVPTTYGIRAFSFYHTPSKEFKALLFKKPLSFFKAIFTNIYQVIKCDKVVICGGGNMTSEWPGVLEARLRLLKVANFFKKDVYFVSQTVGPFTNNHRKQVDAIYAPAKWIGVRDKNFSHTQVSHKVSFALDDACFLEKKHNEYTKDISNKNTNYACVAMRKFGPMSDDDTRKIGSCIQQVISKDSLNTVFIPHHAPEGTEGDIKLINSIEDLWEENTLHIVNPIPLASSLKALTADSEYVISMRYHQLIFALSIGVPCIGIYVNEYTKAKLTGSFESLGLEPLVTHYNDVESNLPMLVQRAKANRHSFESAANSFLQNMTADSMKPYELLAAEVS